MEPSWGVRIAHGGWVVRGGHCAGRVRCGGVEGFVHVGSGELLERARAHLHPVEEGVELREGSGGDSGEEVVRYGGAVVGGGDGGERQHLERRRP